MVVTKRTAKAARRLEILTLRSLELADRVAEDLYQIYRRGRPAMRPRSGPASLGMSATTSCRRPWPPPSPMRGGGHDGAARLSEQLLVELT